jgi:hypothetical protein
MSPMNTGLQNGIWSARTGAVPEICRKTSEFDAAESDSSFDFGMLKLW